MLKAKQSCLPSLSLSRVLALQVVEERLLHQALSLPECRDFPATFVERTARLQFHEGSLHSENSSLQRSVCVQHHRKFHRGEFGRAHERRLPARNHVDDLGDAQKRRGAAALLKSFW